MFRSLRKRRAVNTDDAPPSREDADGGDGPDEVSDDIEKDPDEGAAPKKNGINKEDPKKNGKTMEDPEDHDWEAE